MVEDGFARRPTRAIVDRDAIRSNASIVLKHLTPGVRLMAIVKANGYGHGAVEAARAALAGGATWLGVATVREARELREAGITVPVLVLGSSAPDEAPAAAAFAISLGVGDSTQLDRMADCLDLQSAIRPLSVHVKIDTGMRRFGVPPGHAPEIARRIARHPGMRLEGVYSHFADADAAQPDRMERQFALYRSTLERIDELGIDRGIAHIANSAALLRNRATDLDLVRAGICLYGISPSEHVPLFEGMRPALEWRATIQHIANLAPGDRTGYGGTYVATEHERIALLPVGYADGYSRCLSNRGWAGFQGRRLPIRGRVSMDQTSVGIPADLDLSVGSEITLIGDRASGAPDANELGALIDSIGYEVVSTISRRVPFEYR